MAQCQYCKKNLDIRFYRNHNIFCDGVCADNFDEGKPLPTSQPADRRFFDESFAQDSLEGTELGGGTQ